MSDWPRSELERRYLGAMKRLAFRFLSRQEDDMSRREVELSRLGDELERRDELEQRDELEHREDELERREDELKRRDAMILRTRSLLAIDSMGAMPLSAICGHLGCAWSSTISALRELERGQLVRWIEDPADPDLQTLGLTIGGHAVTDRLRYLLAECGIEETNLRESTRSDEVNAVLRIIQSIGIEHWKLESKIGSEERNGH